MDKKFLGIIAVACIIFSIVFVFGCTMQNIPFNLNPAPQMANDSGATPEGVNAVVNANNQFALELYSKFKTGDSNVFFSPYSISDALAMTYEGARGKTAQEMQSVFHFPEDSNVRHFSFARLYNILNENNKDYTLKTANALWAQINYTFLKSYTDTVKNYYGGSTTTLDFVKDTEGSRKTINSWVEQQTNNKIQDLIPTGVLNDMTRLVLTNAIYFKGTWVIQFEKSDTQEQDFRVSPNNIVKAQMMYLHGEKADFNYTETDKVQVLELPYKGGNLSMLILLPTDDNITAIENSLTLENLNALKGNMSEQRIDVKLPKFTFKTKYFMADTLSEMGMPTAFTWPGADFSGMDGTQTLYISQVIHQAFVDVNEEGTEAAAATSVVMAMGAAMHTSFVADHPFIFMIQDKTTGSILFMGKVVDPTK